MPFPLSPEDQNIDQNYNQDEVQGSDSPPVIPATSTPIVNTESAPATPVITPVTVKPKLTVDEQLQKFYATREPAPVFDQEKADRIQRMGRINQVGQGVKVLGDLFGSAIGANTRRRQPDTTAPALYQSYQNMLDKYEGEKQAYNYRGFQKNLQDAQLGIQRADKETAQEFANRRQTAIEKANEIKALQEQNKWETGQKNKEVDQKETERYHTGMLNRPVAGSVDKANKPITIKTTKNTYTLSPSEASYTRGRAIENLELLKKKYPTWVTVVPKLDEWNEVVPGQFTTKLDPRVKDDDLIRAQKQLDEDEEEAKNNAGSKTITTAPAQTNTAPKTTTVKSLDYSKIH